MLGIQIKQHHIDNGVPESGAGCPIALAIREQFGHSAIVGNTRIFISSLENGRAKYYHLVNGLLVEKYPWEEDIKHTDASLKFMKTFDAGLPVEPCLL